jgi:hypothetical protein
VNRTSGNGIVLGITTAVVVVFLVAGTVTTPIFAHQRQLFTIGDQDYLMIIGSLNEPVFVDDKSGLDFRVLQADPSDPMNSNAEGATPVEGLEESLQVEVAAGDKKMVQEIEPAFGEPGLYETSFYPTVATTISYRIFGDINDTPVNLTFTCTPAGEAGAAPSNTTETISDGVVRKGIAGGFGCPESRSEAGFPEPYTSNAEMGASLSQIESDVASIKQSVASPTGGNDMMVWAGIGLGIVGIAIGAAAIGISSRKKNNG